MTLCHFVATAKRRVTTQALPLMRILFLFPIAIALAFAATPTLFAGQETNDREVDLEVNDPAFARDAGPRLAIDEGHFNFHTSRGRFAPFAELLRNDGFQVTGLAGPITEEALEDVDILVVSNALSEVNKEHWTLPTPSAFTSGEIATLKSWVDDGGALLLIADHFPFPGAAAEMAQAFGFTFLNCFVFRDPTIGTFDVFTREDGSLRGHIITRGRNSTESIRTVVTFTGSALQAPPSARPLIVFPDEFIALLPEAAWDFDENTPHLAAAGYLQGAVMESGEGRVAIFGEAGMFTAQMMPDDPESLLGFNVPEAAQNKQFILNLMRWLSGYLR
jgi:hypothetical protein